MVRILVILLVAWLVLTLLGALIQGLFWLAVIGGLLFLSTLAYAAIKGRDNPSIR